MSDHKKERNAQIYSDWKTGAKVRDMSNYYRITPERIYAIIKKLKDKPKVIITEEHWNAAVRTLTRRY